MDNFDCKYDALLLYLDIYIQGGDKILEEKSSEESTDINSYPQRSSTNAEGRYVQVCNISCIYSVNICSDRRFKRIYTTHHTKVYPDLASGLYFPDVIFFV